MMKLDIHPNEKSTYSVIRKIDYGAFHAITPAFYGMTYQGWGQFLYNGGLHVSYDEEGNINSNIDYFDGPINLSKINCDFTDYNQDDRDNLDDEVNETDPDEISDGT